MRNCVINEYVHVDQVDQVPGCYIVTYEPFENPCIQDTIQGSIYWTTTNDHLSFSCFNNKLFFALGRDATFGVPQVFHLANGMLKSGKYIPYNNKLATLWKTRPEEHFLCVSYYFSEIEHRPNWLEEGF